MLLRALKLGDRCVCAIGSVLYHHLVTGWKSLEKAHLMWWNPSWVSADPLLKKLLYELLTLQNVWNLRGFGIITIFHICEYSEICHYEIIMAIYIDTSWCNCRSAVSGLLISALSYSDADDDFPYWTYSSRCIIHPLWWFKYSAILQFINKLFYHIIIQC